MPILFIAVVVLALTLLVLARKLRAARRAELIRRYAFPKGLIEKLQARRPGLPAKDGQLVARALRQYFLAHLASSWQFVSMPSQVTDDLRHEFILYTRNYEASPMAFVTCPTAARCANAVTVRPIAAATSPAAAPTGAPMVSVTSVRRRPMAVAVAVAVVTVGVATAGATKRVRRKEEAGPVLRPAGFCLAV